MTSTRRLRLAGLAALTAALAACGSAPPAPPDYGAAVEHAVVSHLGSSATVVALDRPRIFVIPLSADANGVDIEADCTGGAMVSFTVDGQPYLQVPCRSGPKGTTVGGSSFVPPGTTATVIFRPRRHGQHAWVVVTAAALNPAGQPLNS